MPGKMYHIALGPLGRVPIPWWTPHGFGLGALVAIAIWLYQMAFPLVSAAEVNAALMRTTEEYGRHMGEVPEHAFALADGAMRVIIYHDHCVAVQRTANGRVRTHLLVDLVPGAPLGAGGLPGPPKRPAMPSLIAPLGAAGAACLDPRFVHPGRFAQRMGERHGAWVEVWRLFEDGCEHMQLFAPASGAWDSNPDGTPRVRWSRCVH